MPGFSSIDDLVSESTSGGKLDTWDFYKYPGSLNNTNAAWLSLWTATGSPGPGAAPGSSWSNYTGGAGGIEFPNRSTDLRFLTAIHVALSNGGTLMLYDRLGDRGSISLTSTGDKTVSSSTFPRYADGKGVSIWVELTAGSSTTNPTFSMNSYTNEGAASGHAGATRQFTQAACTTGTMFRLPVAAGDHGVSAVSTINVATATTGATCNVVALRPIAYISSASSIFNSRDFIMSAQQYVRIYDGATLAFAYLSQSSSVSPTIWGAVRAVYG